MSWILVGIIWEASNVDLSIGVHPGAHGDAGSFSEKKGVPKLSNQIALCKRWGRVICNGWMEIMRIQTDAIDDVTCDLVFL